jgi:uncharacterized membrane protein YccC
MLAFYWKHDVFFEIFRFHTLFTLLSAVLFTIDYFLKDSLYSLFHIFVGVLALGAGTFLLSYTKKESSIFLSAYLAAFYATFILLTPIIHQNQGATLCGLLVLFSIGIFELTPRIKIFAPYEEFFRYFSLLFVIA